MKKIFSVLVAVVSAVTLMAQESPTACDAQVLFKFCFPTTGTDSKMICVSDFNEDGEYVWNNATFKLTDYSSLPSTIIKDGVINNVRGCDSTVTMALTVRQAPIGAAGDANAKGFSVNSDKQVYFSQGNLQFRASADGSGTDLTHICADGTTQYGEFRFAEKQYDWIQPFTNSFGFYNGTVYYDDNGTPTLCSNDKNQRETNAILVDGHHKGYNYKSWIDLFLYASSGYNSKEPDFDIFPSSIRDDWWSTYGIYDSKKKLPLDIANTYYDWGKYNPITNGGNKAGQWRMLTIDEWKYLLTGRDKASEKLMKAKILDANSQFVAVGLILLPDEWVAPEGITLNSGWNTINTATENQLSINQTATQRVYTYNSLTIEQWEKLEQAGAVFLPVNESMAVTNPTNSENNMTGVYAMPKSYDNSYKLLPYKLKIISTNNANSIQINYFDTQYGYAEGGALVRLVCDK